MRHLLGLLMLTAAATGCGKVDDGNAPIDGPPAVTSCTANEFVDCAGDTLRVCNADGTGSLDTACGAAGCNATAERCNTCAPDALACNADGALAACGDDGLPAGTPTACAAGCIDATAEVPAHCAVIEPPIAALAAVCDVPATTAAMRFPTSQEYNTSTDQLCTGGIVAQVGGPAICVVRAGTIELAAAARLDVVGTRALALVADDQLLIAGILDAQARGIDSGPGGSSRAQLNGPRTGLGGGGAGWRTAGAPGGNTNSIGGALNGGVASADPADGTVLIGGVRAGSGSTPATAIGGGGGGAVALIACRGAVQIPESGRVLVGGGGGQGGRDQISGQVIQSVPASGGGSGGYAMIAGLRVELTGRLYANGGGGGGGSTLNDASGFDTRGADGSQSAASCAAGGPSAGSGGFGGYGGCQALIPGAGNLSTTTSQGAGGGSMGYLQTYTPPGVSPTLAPAEVSPAMSLNRNLGLR